MRSLITAAACLLLLNAAANTYEVADISSANKALQTAREKDSVVLKDGVYTDANIAFTNNGIIFTAQHAGKVFFEGNSTLQFGGDKIRISGFVWRNGGKGLKQSSVIAFKNGDVNATHSVLEDCAIIGFNDDDLNTDNKWVSLYGSHNTVTRCLLRDKYNLGATLVVWLPEQQPAYHTISFNYFFNRQNGPNADNGLESMRIGDSHTSFTNAHCTVAFNRFEQCDGEIEIISNKSCHNSYLHNTFYNSNGGLTLRHGNDCRVDGNVFDGQDKELSYGVRIIGEGHLVSNNYFYRLAGASHQVFRAPLTIVNGLVNTPLNGYFQVKRAAVVGNVFVDCHTPLVRIGSYSGRAGMTMAPDTVRIARNAFYTSGAVYEMMTAPKYLDSSYNSILSSSVQADKSQSHAVPVTENPGAGAGWTEESIRVKASATRYTYILAKEAGPLWMR